MLSYLILLEYATIDDIYTLLKIENSPLPDDYIDKEEEIINEFYCKYRVYRIKILRSQAINNLIEIFNIKNGNVIKKYAQRMFYFKDAGYGIVDFESVESMIYATGSA
jgi:hypothetical protein